MKIPFIDLKKQQENIKEDIYERISNVLDHGQYIMGPEVYELEDKLKEFSNSKYVVSCSSGTDALILALLGLNLKPGDVFIEAAPNCRQMGHAIKVVDVIENKEGNKKYMLAQSYYPGQEQHVLLNSLTDDVWYDLNENDVVTPEWLFLSTDLKRFK